MDFLSAEWLVSLGSIIVIDLVLAGDNALVIAMASRHLPASMRRRAILWGMFGAIITRILFVFIVIELLRIPALSLVGGLLLIGIAVTLVNQSHLEQHRSAKDSFWRAIMMIIFADTVMSLDNVLAIAGASRGEYDLVIFGLLLSIPIIVWGSRFFVLLLERYPLFLYVGSGVLFWTAASMIRRDLFFVSHVGDFSWLADMMLTTLCLLVLIVYKKRKGEFRHGTTL